MILNLDPHFQPLPFAKAIAFESFTFSGGELHIRILDTIPAGTSVWISHRLKRFADIGLLLLAVDALRRMGVQEIKAILPYVPAARQDRVMVKGEALSIKVYAKLINQLNLQQIHIYDPHSEVTPALLDRVVVHDNRAFIRSILPKLPADILLIAPDGGALKKIYKLSAALGGIGVVECSKVRDVKTGKLSGFKVFADDLEGKSVLIVDDICDGGGTFLGLAEALKEKKVAQCYLAVSHGIFSRGLSSLSTVFDHLFTTDSFNDVQGPNLTQISLASIQQFQIIQQIQY